MNKNILIYSVLSLVMLASCGAKAPAEAADPAPAEPIADAIVAAPVNEFKVYYDGAFDKKKSFIVISKLNERLRVYADVNGDTVLVANYPACLSLNKGQKERSGDMKTPESWPGKPFTIKQIQDASTWVHDFKDGRGAIKSYGNWFLRLATPFNGIGIHGSTNNESSVPGRASEGCIRLRDEDIIHLHDHYAYVGMPVIILPEDALPLPFEP